MDYDKGKQVIDEELQTTKDKPNILLDKSIIEVTEIRGNNSDSETSPLVTQQNSEEEINVEGNPSKESPEKDADIHPNKELNIKKSNDKVLENKSDTDNSLVGSKPSSPENSEILGNNTDDENDII